jgi:hypothetical protein
MRDVARRSEVWVTGLLPQRVTMKGSVPVHASRGGPPQSRSMIPAAPMPVPTHMQTMP